MPTNPRTMKNNGGQILHPTHSFPDQKGMPPLLRSQRVSFLYPWQQCQMVLNNKISGPHPLPLIWAGTRTLITERLEKMRAYHLIGWGTWLHMTKVEVLNASFASIFTTQTSFQESQFQETVEKVGTRKLYPFGRQSGPDQRIHKPTENA